MDVRVNVPRILQAMRAEGWGVSATSINCGINNKTLGKILNGNMPKRLDAFYRLCDGLKLTMQEALIATTPKTAERSRFHLVPGGRREKAFLKND
jgi:hypothetical protein